MIVVKNSIVSDDVADQRFCCDCAVCRGACCVDGDSGAPLLEEEVPVLEAILPEVRPYMTPEGIAAVEAQGVAVRDRDGDLGTPLIDGSACAFINYAPDGTALCAIEKAYLEGKCDFWKPISCHLYPIRLMEKDGFTHILYHEWSVCVPAKRKGEKDNIPLWKFLKAPLIRRFGEEWYQRLENKINTL